MSSARQRTEIEASKAALEKITRQSVHVFSYPHGSSDGNTSSLVQQSGFEYACGSTPHAVFPTSDPFDLPRIWVPDINGRAFLKWLRSWMGRGFGA